MHSEMNTIARQEIPTLEPLSVPDVPSKPSVRTPFKSPFSLNRQGLIRLFAGIVILAGITVGTLYFLNSLAWQGTDDAFVAADVVQLNSKVSNQVKEVLIYDNEIV